MPHVGVLLQTPTPSISGGAPRRPLLTVVGPALTLADSLTAYAQWKLEAVAAHLDNDALAEVLSNETHPHVPVADLPRGQFPPCGFHFRKVGIAQQVSFLSINRDGLKALCVLYAESPVRL